MKSTRNLSLDVVRGLLSWGVVGVHIMWAAGLWNQLNINIGQWIVDCFMMLSGYVMTQLSLSKETSYGKYIFRRFMRLMPVFAVCFLFSLLIHPLMAGHTLEYTAIWDSENKFYWWHILFHSVLLHGVVPHTIVPYSKFAFLVPAWSISLEWQFYLVLPFILMFLKKFKVLGFLFLSILCKVFLFHRIIEQYFDESFLLVKLPFFLVGIALFILFNAPEFFNMAPLKFKLPSIAWNPLVQLGTISYSTYLIHWPIITIVGLFVPDHSTFLVRVLMFLTAIPMTFLSGMLLYTYVEKPGIALGRRLTSSKPKTVNHPCRLRTNTVRGRSPIVNTCQRSVQTGQE